MVFTLCKAEQPLQGMKLQEREEEKEGKCTGKGYKEAKYKMRLLSIDKKSNILVLRFCVFLKDFIIPELRTKFQLSVIFLSSFSKKAAAVFICYLKTE